MRHFVVILLISLIAGVGAAETKVVKRQHVLPIPENKNMRLFFFEELGVMQLRTDEATDSSPMEGHFDGEMWIFELFDVDGTLADVVRVPLPDKYTERYTVAGRHVDIRWLFETEARFESDGRALPAQLRLVGCGTCVSPETMNFWRIAIGSGDALVYEAKGIVHRPDRPSN